MFEGNIVLSHIYTLTKCTGKYYVEQKKVRSEVHFKVSADFHEEIYRLRAMFDKFKHNGGFSDDPTQIKIYKEVQRKLLGDLLTMSFRSWSTTQTNKSSTI